MKDIIENQVNELYTHFKAYRIPHNMASHICRILETQDEEKRWLLLKIYCCDKNLLELIDNKWAWNLYKESL